jgi:hypothetical protein
MAVEQWHPTPPAGEIIFDSGIAFHVSAEATPFHHQAGPAAVQAPAR